MYWSEEQLDCSMNLMVAILAVIKDGSLSQLHLFTGQAETMLISDLR
jgi:hypothetical protein